MLLAHDYHMSKTEITVNETDKRLEITQFIFIDDLEKALESVGNPFQHLGTAKEVDTADSLVQLYLDQNLSITQGKSNPGSQLEFVGKEISADLTGLFVYLTQDLDLTSSEDFSVTNTILIDQFDDQVNLIYFVHQNGDKDYFVLDESNTTKQLD